MCLLSLALLVAGSGAARRVLRTLVEQQANSGLVVIKAAKTTSN
jgi:hypothetical protein